MGLRRTSSPDATLGAAMASGFAWAKRMVRRQLDTLRRLADAALDAFEAATVATSSRGSIADQVTAIEAALRFHDRVDWALRLIEALEVKLAEDLRRLERGEAPEVVVAAAAAARPLDGEADMAPRPSSARHGRLVHAAFGGDDDFEEDLESEDLDERLDREGFGRFSRPARDDRFAELLKRPIAEILARPTDEVIALICDTLGLPSDWLRLAEDAWERELGEEGPTGRPGSSELPSTCSGQGPGNGGGAPSGRPPDG